MCAGELRLLLVRGRLWECACEALTAGSQQPGVPTVLGFTAKRRLGHLGSSRSSQAGSFSLLQGGPASSCRSSSVAGAARTSTAAPAAVIDLASLPADMEYVCPAAAMGWGVSQDDTAAAAAGGVTPVEEGCHAAAGAAEQQVLALNGVCPVSVASSVAAGAFAAAAGVEEGLGLLDRLLLGRMASPECGMIRWVWACVQGRIGSASEVKTLCTYVSGRHAHAFFKNLQCTLGMAFLNAALAGMQAGCTASAVQQPWPPLLQALSSFWMQSSRQHTAHRCCCTRLASLRQHLYQQEQQQQLQVAAAHEPSPLAGSSQAGLHLAISSRAPAVQEALTEAAAVAWPLVLVVPLAGGCLPCVACWSSWSQHRSRWRPARRQ